MKKTITFVSLLLIIITAHKGHAFDLNTLFGGSSNTSESTSSTIGGIISDLTGSSEFEITQLVGTWKYASPSVAFKSNDVMTNVGGAATSGLIESKLEPYYQTAGISALNLTVDSNLKFTMTIKSATLSGTIEKGENGTLIFNFNAFEKIKIGKVTTYAEKSGNNLSLTFDVSKLISVAEKISSIANNETFKNAVTLLKKYDGIYIGFNVTKK